jgi:hypothetical protein
MHTAITCIRRVTYDWVLGGARRHDALRRHPSTSCGEWMSSDGAAVRGGGILAGRCKGDVSL